MHNCISCRTGIVGVSAQAQEMVAVRGLISDFFDHYVNLCVGFIVCPSVLRLISRKRFTIYEGDWGDYYAARIEVWHKDAATGEETKLVSYPWSFISPSLTQPRRFMMKWKQRLRRAGAMK